MISPNVFYQGCPNQEGIRSPKPCFSLRILPRGGMAGVEAMLHAFLTSPLHGSVSKDALSTHRSYNVDEMKNTYALNDEVGKMLKLRWPLRRGTEGHSDSPQDSPQDSRFPDQELFPRHREGSWNANYPPSHGVVWNSSTVADRRSTVCTEGTQVRPHDLVFTSRKSLPGNVWYPITSVWIVGIWM
jgi:hypothetical protein